MWTVVSRLVIVSLAVSSVTAIHVRGAVAQDRAPIYPHDTMVLNATSSRPFLPSVIDDANEDGVPELLAVRRGGSEFRLLVSTGRSRWAPATLVMQLDEGLEVQDIAVGDTDGDGDRDVAFWALGPVEGDIVLGVLLNDNGTLQPGPTTTVSAQGIEPLRDSDQFDTIAIGDVSGDGIQDLVITSDDVAVLEGDGFGGFVLTAEFDVFARSVEIIDIDGDGFNEIAYGKSQSIRIRRYQDGFWAIVVGQELAERPFWPTNVTSLVASRECAADGEVVFFACDGDVFFGGHLDVLSVSDTFGVTTLFDSPIPEGAATLDLADVVGDAREDLLFPFGVMQIDPDCSGAVVSSEFERRTPWVASVADVDADGDRDVAISVWRGIRVSLSGGVGESRSFSLDPVWDIEIPRFDGSSAGIASGDFDGDGRRDTFISTSNNSSSAVFYQEPDGSFTGALLTETSRSPRAHAADVDGDGLDDAVLITTGEKVQVNYAEPGRAFAPRVGYSVGATPVEARTADIDQDGDLDIVAQTLDGLSVLEQTSARVFELASVLPIEESLLGLALGDFDGDGDTDAAVGSRIGVGVQVAFNAGDGTFDDAIAIDPAFAPEAIDAADFDGDGDLDLIAVGQAVDPYIRVYVNDGAGGFSPVPGFTVPGLGSLQWVETDDINGDGFIDVSVAQRSTGTNVLLGDGAFGFELVVESDVSTPNLNQFVLADFDADGFPDIATVSFRPGGSEDERGGFLFLSNQTERRDVCPADLADPSGVLDLADITAFVSAFLNEEPEADVGARFGVFDLADLVAFVESFVDGCG